MNAKTTMPAKIRPMLAYLVDEPFDGEEWLFETKWDGYRAIAEVDDEKVKLYSRNYLSFNTRFKSLLAPLAQLGVQAIFDGEIVILDKKGRSSFQNLQNYQKTGKGELLYYIFDFLYFEGHDLRELPLTERKKLLRKLLSTSTRSPLRYSNHILAKGKKAFKDVEEKGEEGIMAKKINSSYVSRRSHDWLKIKTHVRQEVIICGFTEPKGSRDAFGVLIVGVYKGRQLQFAGHVGGGFNRKTLAETRQKLIPLITTKCPFKTIPKTHTTATWVKPKLVCEVSFREWTTDNRLRQPIFQGLRIDKKSQEVQKEKPLSIQAEGLASTKSRKKASQDPPLTNLEKVYWPKEGYTKGMLIEYYREIAHYILPYLKNRPESLHRFPDGIEQNGFFQKNIGESFPDWIPTHLVEHKGKTRRYMMIQNKKTLLFAVNLGCIEFHPFSSRIKNLDKPDFVIFDLDPEDVSFDAVRETALVLHEVLEEYHIPNFCKTSGATGLHILVPTGAKYDYEQTRLFAELISSLVHEKIPELTSLERSPAKRQKKVYLDFLQNGFGQTIACPYCVRPLSSAPVSTPLEWSEVKKKFLPTDFTMENTLERLKKKGDIFKPVLRRGFNLSKILKMLNN
jgi:bifunctional non-homologous end joining protein LigD